MFPIATSTRNGMLLWDLAIQYLFGTTYDDILEASDRLRRWHIDPSKNLKYDLHILSQLIERVNETSQHDIVESQILAIINKEILKDPREGLRIIAINSSILNRDDDEYEWKYNDSYDYLKNEEIKPYNKLTMIDDKVRIFKFLDANVTRDREYSHENFIVRSTKGHWYPINHTGGVFHLHYSLNVVGWMEDPFAKSKLQ